MPTPLMINAVFVLLAILPLASYRRRGHQDGFREVSRAIGALSCRCRAAISPQVLFLAVIPTRRHELREMKAYIFIAICASFYRHSRQ